MEPVEIDGVFHLFSDGTDIGILHGREDMLRDWISRDDPFVINHHRANDSEGYNVEVAFYRDKRKNNEWREQSVVALTGFKSKSKQETIECISPGRQLDPEDDFDDHVDICCDGDKIGRLPAKIAKRIIEEGCYGVFYEMSEEIDSGNDYGDIICKPYVRIFWNNKAT